MKLPLRGGCCVPGSANVRHPINPILNYDKHMSLIKLLALSAGTLTLATQIASAATTEEVPAQREWVYQQYADVVTGDLYPAVVLMSRKPVNTSAKDTGVGHGYLSVGNYSKRPMEMTLAWDEQYSKERAAKCKPGGCEVTVRLGVSGALKYIAVQDKQSQTLALQDAKALVAAAERHIGAIEVQVQTVNYGMVSLQFSTASRLQSARLLLPKK